MKNLSRRKFLQGLGIVPLSLFLSSFLGKFKLTQLNELENNQEKIKGTTNAILKIADGRSFLLPGDDKITFTIPRELDGQDLVSVGAHVYTASSKDQVVIQVHHATRRRDLLAHPLTIDAHKKDSADSLHQAVIDTRFPHLSEGDEIRIDLDGAGTSARGLEVRLGFA